MRGLDTNILLRVLMNDDPVQSPIAKRVMQEGNVFIPVSVLLETYWVLRSRDIPDAVILSTFENLLEIPGVTMHEATSVRAALSAHRAGLEFADALHLGLCGRCDEFLTFDDKRFARRAQKQNLMPTCVVPQ